MGNNTLVLCYRSCQWGIIHWYSGDTEAARNIERRTLKILFEIIFLSALQIIKIALIKF